MQPINRRPRRDDRRAWLPLIAVGALIVVVFLAVVVVFRHDDHAGTAGGTLPASFPDLTSVPSTVSPPTTPAPATTAPPAVANPPAVASPQRPTNGTTTTLAGNSRRALRNLGNQRAASTVSDIATIGSNLYAMLVVGGNGVVVRWDGRQWVQEAIADPPGVITSVQVIDVTGDGTKDFVVSLAGPNQAGGVYSRQTFQFQFLPFNTATGRQEFIDHLEVNNGQLQSPFVAVSGTSTLTWTWTGRMFETH